MFLIEILLIVFGLTGLYVANRIRTEKKAGHKMVCPLDGNCEEVLNSDFSKMSGIPLEVAGILYYLFIIFGNILLLVFPPLNFSLLGIIIFMATIFGFFFSIYLIYVQAVILKNWCTWCLFSALNSVIIFGLSLFNLINNFQTFSEIIKSHSWFFILVNILGYALAISLSIVTEFITLKSLKDFKIDKKEKETLMALWQTLWASMFVILFTSLIILIFKINTEQNNVFELKTIILLFIIIISAITSFYVLPKLDKTKIACHVMNVSIASFYRNLAIILSSIILISWFLNLFVYYIFNCGCSLKKDLIIYLIIIFTGSILFLAFYKLRDKKALDKKK